MRPERFQAFTLDTLKNTPGTVQVRTLADAGDTKHPFVRANDHYGPRNAVSPSPDAVRTGAPS